MPLTIQQIRSRAAQIAVDEWNLNSEDQPRFPSTPDMVLRAMGKTFKMYPEDVIGLSLSEKKDLILNVCIAVKVHFRFVGIDTVFELVN
jgi:hypothetical protein